MGGGQLVKAAPPAEQSLKYQTQTGLWVTRSIITNVCLVQTRFFLRFLKDCF